MIEMLRRPSQCQTFSPARVVFRVRDPLDIVKVILARAFRLSVQVAFHQLFLTVELPLLRAQT